MSSDYTLRRAKPDDLEAIVGFTLEEAREAEGLDKDANRIRRGVMAGLEDPSVATYWVAESRGGEIVASTSAVREWSDFNDGYYWWVQSMYILPQHRGQGLVDLLLDRLAEEARDAGAIDLRLYAHGSNERALEAYRRCGFDQTEYVIMRRVLHGGGPHDEG
jgi:ribosomal protein S18 acetylase RimI-like enzyme